MMRSANPKGTLGAFSALAIASLLVTWPAPLARQRIRWADTLGGQRNAYATAHSVAVSPDAARVFVTGSVDGRAVIVAYDAATGRRLWLAPNARLGGSDVAVSPDGLRVYVTGHGGPDLVWMGTVAYDAGTGAQLWESFYTAGYDYLFDGGKSLVVAPDGNRIYVTGTMHESADEFDYATIGLDASTGEQLWASLYGGPEHQSSTVDPDVIGLSPDGTKVYVTGSSMGFGTGEDVATVAYDAGTGLQLWTSRYDGPTSLDDLAHALAVGSDGSVYTTGESYRASQNYLTIANDPATGAIVWSQQYNGLPGSIDIAESVDVSPGGARVFVTGQSGQTGVDPDFGTIAYDAKTGSQLWVSSYGDSPQEDSANVVRVSPDGTRTYVTGTSDGGFPTYYDYATVAYSVSTGAQLWVSRFDVGTHGYETPYGMAVAPDGRSVFVTGASVDGGKSIFVTVATSR